MKSMETKVFAGRIKNKEVLKNSSSGGAFTAISDDFLNDGGAVLCSGYNYSSHQAEFRMVFSFEERDACRGSMYMQSYALDTWKEAGIWLKNDHGRKLVFFGLGCQGAGFVRFCEIFGIRDQVTVVDIICHGAPSPMLWKQYAQSLEQNGRLSRINFRDKRTGWSKSVGIAEVNGQEVSLQKWRRIYSSRTTLRPCCSECPYTTIERDTDITIGDFWHMEKSLPDFYDENGTSLFLIHTKKGMELFNRIKGNLDYRESNTRDCWQMNLEKPTQHAENRANFWKDYKNKGIDYVMEKYGRVSVSKKIIKKLFG